MLNSVLRSSARGFSSKVLNPATINQHVVSAQYAVRGEIVIKAGAMQKELKSGSHNHPFEEIIACNIGNPHELQQKPITFTRQVLAMCQYPAIMDTPGDIPADAVARAQKYLDNISGGVGAYSHSQGIPIVREEVAEFISQRDGYTASADQIFLTDGASAGVKAFMQLMLSSPADGVMIPIPQYPLYSAGLALMNGSAVPYGLRESDGWGMQVSDLEAAYDKAAAQGVIPKGLVVINPGNPTGNCLPYAQMEEIIDFCSRRNVVLFADEVYQENIYSDVPFTSFKKVMYDMGASYQDLELASFHSTSKGFVGECGARGGYVELNGFHDEVHEQLYKLASISLCSNITGQLGCGLMVNPPKEGDLSYPLYHQESTSILASLARRATKLKAAFDSLGDSIDCQIIQGALYAFPTIKLSARAVAAAQAAGKAPDLFYCLAMLKETGIVVVPGSGFGQESGTFHFRVTILPAEDKMDSFLEKFANFHSRFMAKYA